MADFNGEIKQLFCFQAVGAAFFDDEQGVGDYVVEVALEAGSGDAAPERGYGVDGGEAEKGVEGVDVCEHLLGGEVVALGFLEALDLFNPGEGLL